jgi:hypothetical protein
MAYSVQLDSPKVQYDQSRCCMCLSQLAERQPTVNMLNRMLALTTLPGSDRTWFLCRCTQSFKFVLSATTQANLLKHSRSLDRVSLV